MQKLRGTHNHGSLCLAQGLECYYCEKPNHFAKVCRGKSKAGRKPTRPPHRKPARTHSQKNLSHSDSDSEGYLYPVQSKKTARPNAKISVSGHSFHIVVGTGQASSKVFCACERRSMSTVSAEKTE